MKTEIRNSPGQSSYFQGKFKGYGRYQWNIKFYGFESEYEQEAALLWCLGAHIKQGTKASNGNTIRGFENISELLGRPIESSTEGRSGGWLVIDTELTDSELKKIDTLVANCLNKLPHFLEEERTFHALEKLEAEKEERETVERAQTLEALQLELIQRAQSVLEIYLDGTDSKSLFKAMGVLSHTLALIGQIKGAK